MTAYALLVRLHGYAVVLGLALLLHAVVALGRGGRARLTAGLAAGFVLLPSALGWLIYPTYRAEVKPGLVVTATPWALAFETKEHLAALTFALTCGGVLGLWWAGDRPPGRAAARALLLAAFLTGLGAAVLGLSVGARAHAPW